MFTERTLLLGNYYNDLSVLFGILTLKGNRANEKNNKRMLAIKVYWIYSSVLGEMNNRLVAMPLLRFWLIIQVLFQQLYANTQARSVVIGKKFLCVEANPQYVLNLTCKIRLVNRSTQLYNMNIELQPNITLDNIHVNVTS